MRRCTRSGHIPLPPYIALKRPEDERDRTDYQTVYAREEGAVAAPTAGLHFTDELMQRLSDTRHLAHFVTLHVGAGTFLPVKADDTKDHKMHAERGVVDAPHRRCAQRGAQGRAGASSASARHRCGFSKAPRRETAKSCHGTARRTSSSRPATGSAPVDLLMTNFHLPRSTLFMLVSAFSGLDTMRAAYAGMRSKTATASIPMAMPACYIARHDADMHATNSPSRLLATDGNARRGEITMPRGTIRTPAFMPVGTAGTVKAMYMDQVKATGADIILGNTYHLMLRPGAERVARLGGLHEFIRWQGPILTDSGGFQVMSLAALRKLTEEGVTFQSHVDGSRHMMTPERSIEIQGLLGSDIQMQLDECIALPAAPRGNRAGDGTVPALGRALRHGLRHAAGQGDVRDRAGRR